MKRHHLSSVHMFFTTGLQTHKSTEVDLKKNGRIRCCQNRCDQSIPASLSELCLFCLKDFSFALQPHHRTCSRLACVSFLLLFQYFPPWFACWLSGNFTCCSVVLWARKRPNQRFCSFWHLCWTGLSPCCCFRATVPEAVVVMIMCTYSGLGMVYHSN